MSFKIGKGESVINTLSIDSKVEFIITRCLDKINYVIYSVDENGNTNKIAKGEDPLLLINKTKYNKMCKEWNDSHE